MKTQSAAPPTFPVHETSAPECGIDSAARTAPGLRNKFRVLAQRFAWPASIAAGVALLLVSSGCRHSQPRYTPVPKAHARTPVKMTTLTNRLDPAWLRMPTNFFTLGPGDRLEVDLLDTTNSTTTIVGPDGKIYFDLLPGVDVWGMTLAQAKAALEQELGKYVRDQPQLSITLRDVGSKQIWLLGRFQQPGVYPMSGPMTLLEAISMGGGSLTLVGTTEVRSGPIGEDLADLRRSFVIRGGQLVPVNLHRLMHEGDLSQNIYLLPDDFVYFAPAYTKEVYVLGAVLQPRPVQFVEGLTVLGAIAGAYGTVKDAHLSHVTIVRGSLAEPEYTIVDYYDLVKGRVPDIPLEEHDIVYVPFSPYRYLRKYAEIALNTFVSSVAINAGSRAVLGPGNRGPGGVVIPIGSGIQIIPPSAPPIGR